MHNHESKGIELETNDIEVIDTPQDANDSQSLEFYSTKEAAAMIGLHPDTFRHYAKTYEKYLPPIKYEETSYQNRSANFKFTQEHIDLIDEIYSLNQKGHSKREITAILTRNLQSESGDLLVHRLTAQEYLNDDAIKKLLECSFQLGYDKHKEQIAIQNQQANEKLFNFLEKLQGTLDDIQRKSNDSTLKLEDMSQSLLEKNNENSRLRSDITSIQEKYKSLEDENTKLSLESSQLKDENQQNMETIHEITAEKDFYKQKCDEMQKQIDEMQRKKGFFGRLFK